MSSYQGKIRIMRVFVLNMRGNPLMPCNQRKARILLKEGKAVIYKYNPFTIQLTYATGEAKQDCHIGIDTGSKHIGMAITSKDKVLFKGVIELRQDVKSNIDTKRIYRRSRRNRKTRYRKPRFLNRRKSDKWLPPSLQNRIDHTFHWIDILCSLVPTPTLHIEVGKFDTVKMINPEINGIDYQHGQTYGFFDERYFVLARDNYTCQCCGKSKNKILQIHHIIYRSNGGTDRVDNLITVCTDCHTSKNHQKGEIFGINKINENDEKWLLIKQFRKKKRSLHEATARKGRKIPNRNQVRNSKNTPCYKGFYLNDKVTVLDKIGYITGFTGNGAYVKDTEGNYVTLPNKTYKQVSINQLRLKYHNNNWQYIMCIAV